MTNVLSECGPGSDDSLDAKSDVIQIGRVYARKVYMARVYGEVYHARGVAAELRAQALGARTAEESYEGIGWLYGGP